MLARIVRASISLAVLLSFVTIAEAQDRIAPGYVDIGFVMADAKSDDAGVAYGFRVEKLLTTIPSLGNGVLGVQLVATGSAYDFGLSNKWLFIPIGVSATYHFVPGNDRFDPFVALGGGYKFANCVKYPGAWADCSAEDDEFFGIARLGAKYFVSDRVGFTIDGGLGSSYVNGGLVVRLK